MFDGLLLKLFDAIRHIRDTPKLTIIKSSTSQQLGFSKLISATFPGQATREPCCDQYAVKHDKEV